MIPISGVAGVPNGVLMVYGSGQASHFFVQNVTTGTFTSPPNDFGTLTQASGTGTYTYTSKEGVQWNYDNTGLLDTITDPHGLTVTFTYLDTQGREVKTISMPDGGVTTFTYTSGYLTSIQEPGGRTVTLGRSGADLTAVTLPDGSATRSRTTVPTA